MILGFDHIVIVVRDLEAALADYTALGFSVTRGGHHAGLNTHNVLVAFADGAYLELIAFVGEPAAQTHWWYQALQTGGGLTDFCVRSDHVEADVSVFCSAGATLGVPFTMGRERPDGYQLRWELAVNEGESRGLVPFFIRDLTPRDERVPRARSHHNNAGGVGSLAIAVSKLEPLRTIYEQALQTGGEPIERPDLDAAGVRFALGPHELQLLTATGSFGRLAEHLRQRGASPFEVQLRSSSTHKRLLDPARTHGARLVID